MKIVITKNGKQIEVYHHPREVTYKPKANTITVRDTDSPDSTTYTLKGEPKLEWFSCVSEDEKEILTEFEVE